MSNIETEYSQYLKDFNKMYDEKIIPVLKSLEYVRIEKLLKFCVLLGISVLGILISLINKIFFNPNDFIDLLDLIVAIISFCGVLVSLFLYDSFIMDIKSKLMNKYLAAFSNIKYDYHGSFFDEDLKISELFPIFLSKFSDDCFLGKYKDVDFKIAELRLDGEGGKAIFKGVILSLDFNKAIHNKTIVTDQKNLNVKSFNFFYYIFHFSLWIILLLLSIACFIAGIKTLFFGLWCIGFLIFCIKIFIDKIKQDKTQIKHENMQKLELEDPIFSKKYSVYSSDQVEGRYLVTTAFMERFLNLKTLLKAKKAKCSFYDNKIMFAFSTNKNLFEIGCLFKPLTDMKIMQTFLYEIISIYMIIDYFKIDEKTGL